MKHSRPLKNRIPGINGRYSKLLADSRRSDTPLNDDSRVDEWIEKARASSCLSSKLIPLQSITHWQIDPVTGNISHESGKFFSIIGLRCRHREDFHEFTWDQPIIEQAEVGILGIMASEINGVLHICLQAKEEPGNIDGIQLSPTVQATFSNYTRVHGGNHTPFLEEFLNPQPENVILARLQTEDGGRFLYKSNRNMIVMSKADLSPELPEKFIWLTLNQVARLMRRHNLVNACTRSILSSIFDLVSETAARETGPKLMDRINDSLMWLDTRKSWNHMRVVHEGLNELKEWQIDSKGFLSHRDKRFFSVVGIEVNSNAREIHRWCQPIIANPQPGIIGLLVRKSPTGEREMLLQAKPEPGNKISVQLGPTVMFAPGNYFGNRKLRKPFMFKEFSGDLCYPPIFDGRQSEEGARFYKEDNIHRILEVPYDQDMELQPEFRWFTETETGFLLRLGDTVNSCARSIISCLI